MSKVPTQAGFYWGILRIEDTAEEGKDYNQDNKEWEVMHVVDSDDVLKVMVPGLAQWQNLDAFVWGEECHRTGGKEVRAYVKLADDLYIIAKEAIQAGKGTFRLREIIPLFETAQHNWKLRPKS